MVGEARTWIGASLLALALLVLGSVYWLSSEGSAVPVVSGIGAPPTPPAPARNGEDPGLVPRRERLAAHERLEDSERQVASAEGRARSPARLVVRVVDSVGEPLAGARVEFVAGGGLRWGGDTDANGLYVALRLPAGEGSVSARADGFAPSSRQDVQIVEGEDVELVLVLERGLILEGLVRSASRDRAGEAEVRLVPRQAVARPAGRDRHTIADALGSFRFEDVAPGSYVLTASHAVLGRGHVTNLRLERTEGGTVRQDIRLGPVGSISGWIRSASGGTIPVALVRATGRDGADPTPREVESSADGSFTVQGLGAGRYQLDVEAPGFAPARVARASPGSENLTITLDALVKVQVRAFDARDGAPIPSYRLSVRMANPLTRELGRFVGPTRSIREAAGSVRIDDLQSGTYVVEVQAPGFVLGRSQPFTLAPGGPELELPVALTTGAVVVGRLVRDADASGVEDAEIWAETWFVDSRFPEGVWSPTPLRVRSDAEGRFRLEFGAAGRYRLVVLARGHAPAWTAPLDLRPTDGVLELSDLRLEPAATLNVHVQDALGEAAADVDLRLAFLDHAEVPDLMQRTNAAGKVRFENLPSGRFRISASSRAASRPSDLEARVRAELVTHLIAGRVHEETLRLEP